MRAYPMVKNVVVHTIHVKGHEYRRYIIYVPPELVKEMRIKKTTEVVVLVGRVPRDELKNWKHRGVIDVE